MKGLKDMFSDRDVEIFFSDRDPAFYSDDLADDENEQLTKEVMADLFKDIEKVFAKLNEEEWEIVEANADEIADRVDEILNGEV